MTCDDCQIQMSERLDTVQPVPPNTGVEHHLAECSACRAFHNAWTVLDAQLTLHAGEAVLPANFKQTLLTKLPTPRRSPVEVAALGTQFEREHREALAALQRRYLFLDAATLLRHSVMISGFAVVIVLLNALGRTLPEAIGRVLNETGIVSVCLTLSLSVSLAATLFGLNRVWRPFRQRMPGG